VVEVFRVEGVAAKFLSGGDDRGVPMGELMAAAERRCTQDEFQGDRKDRNLTSHLQQGINARLGDAEFRFSKGIGDKLLENLRRESEAQICDKGLSDRLFGRICRSR